MGMLMITHYQRILNYVKPDFVHVYYDGKIISTGDAALAEEIEEKGYTMIKEEEEV
jgi:Fe-S cluster assembly ATP-binding protein